MAEATAQIQGPFLLETYRRIGESVRMHDVLGRVGERYGASADASKKSRKSGDIKLRAPGHVRKNTTWLGSNPK